MQQQTRKDFIPLQNSGWINDWNNIQGSDRTVSGGRPATVYNGINL